MMEARSQPRTRAHGILLLRRGTGAHANQPRRALASPPPSDPAMSVKARSVAFCPNRPSGPLPELAPRTGSSPQMRTRFRPPTKPTIQQR